MINIELNKWFQTSPRTISFLLWTFFFFSWYAFHPLSPDIFEKTSPDWWDWWDQSNYLQITKEITTLEPNTDSFWPGYSMIGAVFYALFPSNPFFFVSFICGFIVFDSIREIISAGNRHFEGLIVSAVLCGLHYKFIYQSIIIPWNNIFIYAFFALLVKNILLDKWSHSNLNVLIIFSTLSFFSRPQDGFFAVAFCSFAIWIQRQESRKLLLSLKLIASVMIASSITFIYLFALWKGEPSAYLRANISHGFDFSEILLRLYTLFFNGSFLFDGEYGRLTILGLQPSVLVYNPLACFGWLVLITNIFSGKKEFFLASTLSIPVFFYLSFNPVGNPVHFWTYSLFHYIWINVTLFAAIGYIELRKFLILGQVNNNTFFCILVFILLVASNVLPYSGVRSSSAKDVSNPLTLIIENKNLKKIYFYHDMKNAADLSLPGQELSFEIRVNNEKLIPWRDYYLNSGNDWSSVFFINSPQIGSSIFIHSNQNELVSKKVRLDYFP